MYRMSEKLRLKVGESFHNAISLAGEMSKKREREREGELVVVVNKTLQFKLRPTAEGGRAKIENMFMRTLFSLARAA